MSAESTRRWAASVVSEDLRRAAEILESTPAAAKTIYRDVDGRTFDEVATALRVAADRVEAEQ